jgi:shikimate kinase
LDIWGGKSTLGKTLSEIHNIPLVDLDSFIEESEGLSITELFRLKGEIYFRKIEAKYLEELALRSDEFILSVGGGTPVYGNNMKVLVERFKTVYLRANVPTLFKRLSNKKDSRPLIKSVSEENLAEFIGKHLFERSSFYERSEFIVDVNNKSLKESIVDLNMLFNE